MLKGFDAILNLGLFGEYGWKEMLKLFIGQMLP